MTAERKMLFPFTNQKEILYWADLYTKDQTPKGQRDEEGVRKIRENVKAHKKPETPGGYLTKNELMEMGDWKRHTLRSQMVNNPVGHVEKITAAAFRPSDDWEKLEKLIDIDGVGQPVASTILHLYDDDDYPILDKHALRSIGIDHRKVKYDAPSGGNMSNSAVRNPSVMTFVCGHWIGRYTSFHRAARHSP